MGSAATYFSTEQPTKFAAVMTCSEGSKNNRSETMAHDLSVYDDLPHALERD